MSGAMQWAGTKAADHFVFDEDYDRLDFVLGGAGDDYISDGGGDQYWSSDVYFGQKGNDRLISTDGNDLLSGGIGDDDITVHLGWYDPAELQFPVVDGDHVQVGFDVEVRGGKGWDSLTLYNSHGYSVEHAGQTLLIHSVWGGTVTVRGVEEFHFV